MDLASILNSQNYQQESAQGGNSAQAQIPLGPYQADALVFVSATGSATYQGPVANAGITVAIRINDAGAAIDDSFEGSSTSIHFRASASHAFLLKRGQQANVEGRTDPYGTGAGGNTAAKIALSCFAVAVRPEGYGAFA